MLSYTDVPGSRVLRGFRGNNGNNVWFQTKKAVCYLGDMKFTGALQVDDRGKGDQSWQVHMVSRYSHCVRLGLHVPLYSTNQVLQSPKPTDQDALKITHFPSILALVEIRDGKYGVEFDSCCDDHHHGKQTVPGGE